MKSELRAEDSSNSTVLLVEDSTTIAAIMKHFLEREGFKVLLADNGHTGLEIARQARPDVVVSDLYMPDMDGISLAKALHADPLTRNAVVLMVTSETNVDKQMEALSSGVDQYLLKPVAPLQLVTHVKAICSRSAPSNSMVKS